MQKRWHALLTTMMMMNLLSVASALIALRYSRTIFRWMRKRNIGTERRASWIQLWRRVGKIVSYMCRVGSWVERVLTMI